MKLSIKQQDGTNITCRKTLYKVCWIIVDKSSCVRLPSDSLTGALSSSTAILLEFGLKSLIRIKINRFSTYRIKSD